jgi:glycosyltransferase involved in cell wall biosynthesis
MKRLAVVWAQFAPYHLDRLDAAAAALAPAWRIAGIELARASARYPWPPADLSERGWDGTTLFADRPLEWVGEATRTRALLAALTRRPPDLLLLCNWHRPHALTAALWARATGVPVAVACDSRAADKPRGGPKEAVKRAALAPYRAGLAAGGQARAYLAGLGVPHARIATGHATVSVARVRRLAGGRGAGGFEHADRPFVLVARLAREKNVAGALDAYAAYRRLCTRDGLHPRRLEILGDGPLRESLAAHAARRCPDGVAFHGFLPPGAVARRLAGALALVLPSWREPWGLAVNEAVALGVPVLASTRVGAGATLVRDGLSGHRFAPDDHERLARQMLRLTGDADHWRRLAAGSAALADRADSARFAEGVGQLTDWLA